MSGIRWLNFLYVRQLVSGELPEYYLLPDDLTHTYIYIYICMCVYLYKIIYKEGAIKCRIAGKWRCYMKPETYSSVLHWTKQGIALQDRNGLVISFMVRN